MGLRGRPVDGDGGASRRQRTRGPARALGRRGCQQRGHAWLRRLPSHCGSRSGRASASRRRRAHAGVCARSGCPVGRGELGWLGDAGRGAHENSAASLGGQRAPSRRGDAIARDALVVCTVPRARALAAGPADCGASQRCPEAQRAPRGRASVNDTGVIARPRCVPPETWGLAGVAATAQPRSTVAACAHMGVQWP